MNPEILALMIPIIGLSIPIVAIVTAHKRKIEEMRLQRSHQAEGNVVAELQALRQQIAEVRDTSTRYDMSFDAALQRIESRVGRVEQRLNAVEQDGQSSAINSSVR